MRSYPSRVSNSTTYDGAVSHPIQCANGDLLVIYHQSDMGHVAPDGRIVMQRSTDTGRSWSPPRPILDEPERDILDPSVIYDPESGDVMIISAVTGFADPVDSPADLETAPERTDFDLYLVRSTDHGNSWSSPRSLADQFQDERIVPFGGGVWTEQGLVTCFYSAPTDELTALISSDRGQTWETVTIAESPPGRRLVEPVPCRLSDSKVLLFGRENVTGMFYALKSTDGGNSWGEPVLFDLTAGASPTPLWVKKTGPNRLTAVWGDRDDLYIYAVSMSAQLAWQDPTALGSEPRNRLHEYTGTAETASYWNGGAGDFGYPRFVQLGPDQSDILLTFYDGHPWPDIWQLRLY